MNALSAKIADLLRNFKIYDVRRSPQPRYVEPSGVPAGDDNEYCDTSDDEHEEPVIIVEEPDDEADLDKDKKPINKDKKPLNNDKKKKPKGWKRFFTPKSKTDKPKKRNTADCIVNTTACNKVTNVVKSKNTQLGHTIYMTFPEPQPRDTEVENVKCNDTILLMEATVKPEHEYLDLISKNLGKNWYGLFLSMGYLKGRIETEEINRHNVEEARYQLLLDWVRNDDDGTLGCLATKLWAHGDRELVKKLALIYKKNDYK